MFSRLWTSWAIWAKIDRAAPVPLTQSERGNVFAIFCPSTDRCLSA